MNSQKLARFGWREAALALLIAVLAYQVIIPFVMIIWTSLKLARPGQPDFLSLSFTLANYLRAYGSAAFWRTSWNTLSFALASTLLAFVIGAFLAWVLARTNTPLAGLIGFLLIGRIVIPRILIAISWILVASPKMCPFNQMMLELAWLPNPGNSYSSRSS